MEKSRTKITRFCSSRKEFSMNSFGILDHAFDPTKIYGAPIVIGNGAHLGQTVFCGELPPLNYSKVEKLYWQNDVDGCNALIDRMMSSTDIRPKTIHFSKDSFLLRDVGIVPRKKPEVIDITSVKKYDVFFGIDTEGDLVRAEV